jgi:hypothetical protein
MPGDVHDDVVCQCGGSDDPSLTIAWEHVQALVLTRSAGKCEIRSPQCLVARHGYRVAMLPEHERSLHHRRPRGMGGTRRADTHTAANLLLVCGSGVTGCHAYAESHRELAYERGWLVRQGDDPARTPLVLHSGRRVLLDPHAPGYLSPQDGIAYAP